ncbi:hypothetical protein DFH09DRAFT_1307688 [Mycena vulgaris]|nr:hypothetical protein DFH09DRAFT_1307688 [Mycena vulgaris]
MRIDARQSTCSPNLEGAGVSIVAGDVEWGVSALNPGTYLKKTLYKYRPNTTADWHVQQTGSSPATYFIREINHDDLAVSIDAAEGLRLEKADPANAYQLWTITCSHCLPGAASYPNGGKFAAGCSIKSVPTGRCAEVEHGGDEFKLAGCNPVIGQTYDLWTATRLDSSATGPASKPNDKVAGNLLTDDGPATCSPNLEGAGVSVVAGDAEWGVSALAPGTFLKKALYKYRPNTTADWHVQQTGSSPATYFIREINHDNLAVSLDNTGTLMLAKADPANASQLWTITCSHCLPGAASYPIGGKFAAGCSIKSVANGLCAEVEHGGEEFYLTGCNPVIAQTYDLWTATGLDASGAADPASTPKVAGNLLADDASVSGTVSDSSKYGPIIIGLVATNLVLVLVLAALGALSYFRPRSNGSRPIPRYVPVKVKDDALLASYPTPYTAD